MLAMFAESKVLNEHSVGGVYTSVPRFLCYISVIYINKFSVAINHGLKELANACRTFWEENFDLIARNGSILSSWPKQLIKELTKLFVDDKKCGFYLLLTLSSVSEAVLERRSGTDSRRGWIYFGSRTTRRTRG